MIKSDSTEKSIAWSQRNENTKLLIHRITFSDIFPESQGIKECILSTVLR